MTNDANLSKFLGTWMLIPDSCRYEQGDPPQDAIYVIERRAEEVWFVMVWTDAEGKEQRAEFGGVPDGSPAPFAGGDLADALTISMLSDRDLRTAALWKGKERMLVQRQLDGSDNAMRITQVVRLPDGTAPANIGVYQRLQQA